MTYIPSSQGAILATVMIVSGTVVYFAFSKQITLPQFSKTHHSQPYTQNLLPYLCSVRKMKDKEKKKKKKKKRVEFADDVKDTKGNREEYRKEKEISMLAKQEKENTSRRIGRPCRDEIQGEVQGMPANRIVLYNGILRKRVHRMECSN